MFVISDLFTIERETGIIHTAHPLDYEATTTYSFSVFSQDTFNGSGTINRDAQTSEVPVTVVVVDVNDNVPVFSQEVYRAEVEEGATAQRLIKVF